MDTVVDINRIMIDAEVIAVLPAAMVRRLKALPVAMDEDNLLLAMANPDDDRAVAQVEAHTKRVARVVRLADPSALEPAIRRYYPAGVWAENGTPLALLEQLVNRALQIHCSDIHIDPEPGGGCVRMRVDGMLRLDRRLEAGMTGDLLQAVKVAANLDIAEKRLPQDGQITIREAGEEISLRVAAIPTIYGEKITLRILASAASAGDLSRMNALGMCDEHYAMMQRALDYAYGMILLSGPTGSGKTTTLYAALRHLRETGTLHILSIEDPVEIPLPGIIQVRVDGERVAFNDALRSALRHDPDVIMIGEIRDGESADIAVKSAMTGHLVLSTLHTNDAASVVSRLLNLGIPPDQLTAVLRLAVAQRLVRRPCPHCAQMRPADERQRALFNGRVDPEYLYPVPAGCSFCAGTGYAGRLGIYEMLDLDQELRGAIMARADAAELARRFIADRGRRTLRSDGLLKAAAGLTTLDEVQRVTYTGELQL